MYDDDDWAKDVDNALAFGSLVIFVMLAIIKLGGSV